MKIKKVMLSLLLPAVGFALSMDDRVTELEKKFSAATTKTEMGDFGAKNADGTPHNTWTGLHIQGGITYILPSLEGTAYGIKDNQIPVKDGKLNGVVANPNWDWDFGFKIGAGYKLPGYDWDLSLDYTYQRPKGQGSVDGHIETNRVLGKTGDGIDYATKASSNVDIKFDMLDLTLTSSFFTNRSFALDFIAGVRSHWLDIEQKTTYSGGDLVGDQWKAEDGSKFWGMGPTFGFNTRWYLGTNFSIYSSFGVSCLYGNMKPTNDQLLTGSNEGLDATSSYGIGVPEVNGTLGVEYGQYLSKREYYARVRLGYDYGYYIGVYKPYLHRDDSRHISAVTTSNNLTFHGLVADVRLDF